MKLASFKTGSSFRLNNTEYTSFNDIDGKYPKADMSLDLDRQMVIISLNNEFVGIPLGNIAYVRFKEPINNGSKDSTTPERTSSERKTKAGTTKVRS